MHWVVCFYQLNQPINALNPTVQPQLITFHSGRRWHFLLFQNATNKPIFHSLLWSRHQTVLVSSFLLLHTKIPTFRHVILFQAPFFDFCPGLDPRCITSLVPDLISLRCRPDHGSWSGLLLSFTLWKVVKDRARESWVSPCTTGGIKGSSSAKFIWKTIYQVSTTILICD